MEHSSFSPLVSVIVISYNSSLTVIETLDSIKKQSYRNIEIVITDDCSQDDTIEKCQLWKNENASFFQRIKIVESPSNTGISANLNRGLVESRGDWCKLIAADDILFPNCIELFVSYSILHRESKCIFAKMHFFNQSFLPENIDVVADGNKYPPNYGDYFNETNDAILSRIARNNFLSSPTMFVLKSVFYEYGFYDEQYRLCEDYPMFVSLLEKGVRFSFMDEFVVGYRRNNKSLTSTSGASLFNMAYVKCEYQIKKQFCFTYLSWVERNKQSFIFFIHKVFDRLGMNKNCLFFRFLYKGCLGLIRAI